MRALALGAGLLAPGLMMPGLPAAGLASAGLASAGLAAAPGGLPSAAALAQAPRPRVPTPGYTSELLSAGCVSASRCWAVGDYQVKNATHDQILSWDGDRWQRARTPRPRGQAGLAAISCPSPHECLAVGWTAAGKAVRAQVLRWDGGRWAVAAAPAGLGALNAISCAGTGDCWALDTVDGQNIAVHWNGQRWERPVTFSVFGAPSAVSCISATDCWAAGFAVKPNSIDLANLVLHWNGHRWSRTRVPQPTAGNVLAAVTCVSRADCWAVGNDDTRTGSHTRNEALHWDGSRWSLVHTPKGPHINSELLGISCRLPGDCWAVGDDEGAPQALHWTGHRWALVHAPNPGGAGFLFDVRCPARADCVAVGFHGIPPVTNLALHWNGTRWHTQ
jgi:hypothetical protein